MKIKFVKRIQDIKPGKVYMLPKTGAGSPCLIKISHISESNNRVYYEKYMYLISGYWVSYNHCIRFNMCKFLEIEKCRHLYK